MEYKLYNKIKKTLINDYNIIGGYYQQIQNTDNIERKLDDLKDYTGFKQLSDSLKEYKKRIEELVTQINIYIPRAENIPKVLDPEENIKKLHENEKFKELVDSYNQQLKEKSWNKERINNEIYNFDDPNKEDLFKGSDDIDGEFKTFNQQLLLLFGSVLDKYNDIKDKSAEEQKKDLLDNLDQEIIKLNQLISIAKEFSLYIDQRKDNILKILKIEYNDTDLVFIDNSSNNIKINEYLKELKEEELKPESRLNLKEIKGIELKIDETIKSFEIKEEIKKLKDFNILDKADNIDLIFNIDDVITINSSQQGGDLETRFIINDETNKKLLSLLKLFEKLYDNIDKVLDESYYLKEIKYRYNYYIAYLFLLIKQSASKDTIYVYNYLSKEKVQVYINILNKIKIKFSSLSENNKNTIKLNKYHYIIIEKLSILLQFINSKFPSDTHLLDVEKCTGKIQNDLILFNHFKSILKSYVESVEGREVTGITDPQLL
jgi:hypothetical protein